MCDVSPTHRSSSPTIGVVTSLRLPSDGDLGRIHPLVLGNSSILGTGEHHPDEEECGVSTTDGYHPCRRP